MRLRSFIGAAHHARERLGLAVLVVGVLALAALISFGAVFAGATEDVTQHNGMALHDTATLRSVIAERSGLLDNAAKVVSDSGGVAIMALLAIIAGIWFWRRGLRVAVALAPSLALGVSGAAVVIVKNVVGRTRPPVSLHLVSESNASFPSGHATDSAAVCMTIALVLAVFVFRRPAMRALSVLGAGLVTGVIGASRLLLGVHWPTDVLAGWALGITIALAVSMSAALLPQLRPPSDGTSGRRFRRIAWRAVQLLNLKRDRRELLRSCPARP